MNRRPYMRHDIFSDKSRAFGIRIVKLANMLKQQGEHIMSKQIIRSATSIGANIRESIRAQSSADFISKREIALKEAEETAYWLELLVETGYITDVQFNSLYDDVEELIKLLVSSVVTIKNKTKSC